MTDAQQKAPEKPRRSLCRRIARGLLRCFQFFFLLIFLYFCLVLIGLIPVNNGGEKSEQVEIIVTSTEIHADLILPLRNETKDWSRHFPPGDFQGDITGATHVAFGWGNKEFYVDTRSWDDVRVGTVCRALFWPSPTCMRVNMCDIKGLPAASRRAAISREQYRRLVEHVMGTFRSGADGRFLLIEGGAYGPTDAFYHAHGAYNVFNTCNCWVGRGLKVAGVRTGWFTPLPKTVYLYMSPIPAE